MATAAVRDIERLSCAWCGFRPHEGLHPALVARAGLSPFLNVGKSGKTWMGCPECGTRTPAYRDDEGVLGIDMALQAWRRGLLLKPGHTRRRSISARSIRAARGQDAGDNVLETLARMLAPSSYRVPNEGRSTRPGMQMTDVAAALGMMRDPLAREVALSVVTRVELHGVARLSLRATPRVARAVRMQRPVPLDLTKPANRWRLRLVTFDAAYELVWPEHRRAYRDLARDAKMRKHTYTVVHRCATHTLQDALNSAREDLRYRLSRG